VKVKITTNLPDDVHGIVYVKNTHFIELEDDKGNRTKLNASGLLIGQCQECKERVVALTNQGKMTCTHCGSAVKWAWTRPQLAFVPEHESKFLGWDADKNAAAEEDTKP